MTLPWRQCALVLLFVFVWDLGFDLLAPLHVDPESLEVPVGVAEAPDTGNHPDCGLPDHKCALSHHHHFPALVSTAQSLILPVASNQQAGTPPAVSVHCPLASRLIRAPPAEV